MTASTVARVPNAPKTPQRTIRIADDLWEKAQAAAAERDETVSDVLRRALERYVKAAERDRK